MITITNEEMVKHLAKEGWIREYAVNYVVDEFLLGRFQGDARGLQERMWRTCEEALARGLVKDRLFTKTLVEPKSWSSQTNYVMSGMVLVPR